MLLITAVLITALSNAQTIKGKAENSFVIQDQDKLIVANCELEGKKATLKVTLYDENLTVLKEYQKLLPVESGKFNIGNEFYGNLIFIWIKGKSNTYYLELTRDLQEKSFYEDKKTVPKGANEVMISGINTDSSNIDYNFDSKERTLTMLQSTQAENGPFFKKMWSASFSKYKNIVKWKQFVDNDNIVIDFSADEKGGMNEYLAKVDKKTGTIQYTVPVVYPNEKDALRFQESVVLDFPFPAAAIQSRLQNRMSETGSISNKPVRDSYYDKQTKNSLLVGQFNSSNCHDYSENKKIENYALGLIMMDKDGKVVNSNKINFPDYNVPEPKHVSFKYRTCKIVNVGKLANGNYFITAINEAQYHNPMGGGKGSTGEIMAPPYFDIIFGYSYYEIDSKLNVVNSNFTIEENYAKTVGDEINNDNAPAIKYENVSGDGKYVVVSENNIYNYRTKTERSYKLIDASAKGKKPKELFHSDNFKEDSFRMMGKTGFDYYIFAHHIVNYFKAANSDEYEIKSITIE